MGRPAVQPQPQGQRRQRLIDGFEKPAAALLQSQVLFSQSEVCLAVSSLGLTRRAVGGLVLFGCGSLTRGADIPRAGLSEDVLGPCDFP